MDKIEERPEVFALLCRGCHHLVTITQRIGDQSRFERLVWVMTNSRRGAGPQACGARPQAQSYAPVESDTPHTNTGEAAWQERARTT